MKIKSFFKVVIKWTFLLIRKFLMSLPFIIIFGSVYIVIDNLRLVSAVLYYMATILFTLFLIWLNIRYYFEYVKIFEIRRTEWAKGLTSIEVFFVQFVGIILLTTLFSTVGFIILLVVYL